MKKLHLVILLITAIVSCNNEANNIAEKETKAEVTQTGAKLFWHWEDDFSEAEKTKIKKYITAVSEAAFKLLGNYPFDVHYYFHRSVNSSEPIPWAHTERKNNKQGVRFYINPDFDYEVLLADWTAPHEISHLSIPYLGKENSWFSEGYASYMQYQVMQELGVYTEEEVKEKYQNKIENIQVAYSSKLIFTENAKALRAKYNYPAMYWGGAKYFMHADSLLSSQEGSSLNALIKEYQLCCRGKDKDLKMLLHSLDKNLKTPVFTSLYKDCCTKSFADIYR